MKVIVAGSRTIKNQAVVDEAMRAAKLEISEIVSGGADGVDTLGETWAHARGLKVTRFPPDWEKHGKAAGPIRNDEMADYADALVAVWDGVSKGTKHVIAAARQRGLKIYVALVPTT